MVPILLMDNKVQLISYVNRFGLGGITSLHDLLKVKFADTIKGVHLLPFFYPIDGADAGYDPHDNRVVDDRLGTWEDIRDFSCDFPVMVDLIVNHISCKSKEFQDVVANGFRSEYFELFLTKEKVFGHVADEEDVKRIFRPRPMSPFTTNKLANGVKVDFWTTFSKEQMDIDVTSSKGDIYINSVLETFAKNGVKTTRLDAVGYALKKEGTSCFMIPETYDFIERTVEKAHKYGIEVLVEIHAHHKVQIQIAKYADYVYDFALPPLVLHSLFSKNFNRLKHWYSIRPENCITVLDTHDGIGVMDVASNDKNEGLLSEKELDCLVETIHVNSRGQSRQATGEAASNLDLYQVNCTFYDALSRDDKKYLMARAIQLFSPGIPQVYYVGLLAGSNDMDLLSETNVGRDINRRYYSRNEIDVKLNEPVVKSLLKLLKFRNEHPSFDGEFQLLASSSETLHISWEQDQFQSILMVDLVKEIFWITYTNGNNEDTLV